MSNENEDSTVPPIELTCEHCHDTFEAELNTPIAVRCTHCNSVFDARLQFVRGARKDFQKTGTE
jgi:protein-arginine kinase activator protein McsA